MGFAQDYIEYDEQRNFLYFKDREKVVEITYKTTKLNNPKYYNTMQVLVIYEKGELGVSDGDGGYTPHKIELLSDYKDREYFYDEDEENKSTPLYFEVRSEFVGVELVKITEDWSGETSHTYYHYKNIYKLIYNKRIYKSTLLKEIANAQAKRGEADKEQTNLDKLQQGGYI